MENITIQNLLLAILGLSIYALLAFKNRKQGSKPFNFLYWFQHNWAVVLLSVLCTLSLLFFLDEITGFIGIHPEKEGSFTKITALATGYLNQSLFKQIFNTWHKK